MMKNKIAKIIVNGGVLAAIAAVGITAYQLGTTPVKEEAVPQEMTVQPEEEPILNSGSSQTEEKQKEDFSQQEEEPDKTAGGVTAEQGNTTDTELAEGQETASETVDAQGSFTEDSEAGETTAEETTAEINTEAAPDFSEDTLMEWPVNGNIVMDYSMDQTVYFPTLDQYKLSPAIAVSAVEDAPVVAAADGVVYSVTQDAVTGTTVTMELGNGYQAVYGQLKDLSVEEGDAVKKGTTIGCISAPTKYYSTEGSNLYFQMKKDGTSIDPIAYLP